jgi:hypothetical protein
MGGGKRDADAAEIASELATPAGAGVLRIDSRTDPKRRMTRGYCAALA